MEIAKGAGRPGFVAAHPVALAVRHERGQIVVTEPVPPVAHRLVAEIEAALEEQMFHVPQRQREANVHGHHHADYLRRRVEIPEWLAGLRG
jgi:hypothetical protein